MTRNTDRILVTHAGSLPRPDDVIELVWAKMDGQEVDEAELGRRVESGVAEIVKKQRDAGVDIVSDGELGKPGFSTYVEERFTGFDGRSEFQADPHSTRNFGDLGKLFKQLPSQVTRRGKLVFRGSKIIKKRQKKFKALKFKAPEHMKATERSPRQEKSDV